VVKETTGLNEYDRGELFELLKILASRMTSTVAEQIDADELARRLDVPMLDANALMIEREEQAPEEQPEVNEEEEQPEQPPQEEAAEAAFAFGRGEISLAAFMERIGMAYDPDKALPRDVLDKILSEPLDPVRQDDIDATITEEDIERVKRILDDVPELADLETVEAINEQE